MTTITPSLDTASLLRDATVLAPQVIAWRRQLHMRPEVAFDEHETARFIRETLASIDGLEITRPTETSVVARLVGGRPGRTIAVRADIDALPILEENDSDYRSQIDGAMHACGHDGHTAIVLGLVTLLARHRDALCGEARFIFQHAEEVGPGGAEELVQLGVLDGVDQIIGLHLWSTMPVGQIGLIAGPAMAAPDSFQCQIIGRGGHAAAPHQTIDPIAIGAQVVTALQHIVSRATDPLDQVVVSVTQFIAGTTHNVIPGAAFLGGTVRTFDEAVRARVPELMRRMIKGITEAHGATFEIAFERGYRPVVNDAALTERLRGVVARTLGDRVLADMRPSMGGEDFSAYQQRVPGVFAFVGAGNVDAGIAYPHHHPRFQIDEQSLDVGLRYLVAATLDLLQ
jgi:amidohydrolase